MKPGRQRDVPPVPALLISGTPQPTGQVGSTWSFTPTVEGGTPPYTHAFTAGGAPAGTTLNASTGITSGTLTTEQTITGTVQRVTDSTTPTPKTADLAWGDVVVTNPPVVPDGTLQLQAGTTRWASDELLTWLDSIPDNEITVTVTGDVTLQAWGFYAPQTDGQTQTWVRRELYEYLKADATAAAASATAYWTLSALDGPNETGSLVSFVLTFDVLSTPVLTIDTSSRTRAGFGGFPLSRFGTATDWVINTQSTSGAFAIWDNEAIAWAGTYGGARTVTNPTLGNAAYTVTVSSASLGVSNVTITFNVLDTIIDIRPSPARDNPTSITGFYNQLAKTALSGDASGVIYWGDIIVSREGVYNPTAVSQSTLPLQPTQKVGGPAVPASPYGTNTVQSWEYNDGWNPGWITITCDVPTATQIKRWQIDCKDLTNTTLGYRFSGLNLYKDNAGSNITIYIRDTASTTRGVHCVAFDHNLDPSIADDENGYSTMWIIAYNIWDCVAAPPAGTGVVGPALMDSQIWGNLITGSPNDVFGHFMINTVEGSGKTRFCFNLSTDKLITFQGHPDFYQPNAASVHAPYKAIPAGGTCDIGDEIGNIGTMGRGYLLTADDITKRNVYTSNTPANFTVGETVQTAGGAKQMVITSITNTTSFYATQTVGLPFNVGEVITGLTSGATATVSNTLMWSGSTAAGNSPPTSANIGQATNDEHGWFANPPTTTPNVGTYRSGLAGHKFVRAANMIECADQQCMLNQPPATTGSYLVNNLTTFPWGIIYETGTPGAYYEAGRFNPGVLNLLPTSNSAAGVGSLSVRNVLVCANSVWGGSYTINDNLIGTSYGSPPQSITFVPTNVTLDWNNPVGCANYTDIRDIIEFWTPTVGSQLRSQGTVEIFGPFDTGMVDFRRHTYDRARLTSYA